MQLCEPPWAALFSVPLFGKERQPSCAGRAVFDAPALVARPKQVPNQRGLHNTFKFAAARPKQAPKPRRLHILPLSSFLRSTCTSF